MKKIILTLSALLLFTWVTYAFMSMPDLIDNLNEEKITYEAAQETLKSNNDILRAKDEKLKIESDWIKRQIQANSQEWAKLSWKIEVIDATIKMIENPELGL